VGGRVEHQTPVKLFFALMAGSETLLKQAEERLETEFGPVDLRDDTFSFDPLTSYYASEFGEGLLKRIVAVEPLVAPERLVDIKIRTNEMELEFAAEPPPDGKPCRQINLDPGYLNQAKVVLATTKDRNHRLYVARGIFEEVTLCYQRVPATYTVNPWTYPDYRMPERLAFFNRLRQRYREQLPKPGQPE
jgi:hypothetical protein